MLWRGRTGGQIGGGQVWTDARLSIGHVQRHVRLGERVHRAGGYLQFAQIAQVVVAVVVVGVIGGEQNIFVQSLVVAVLLVVVVEAKCQLIVAGDQVAARSAMV